MTNLEIIKLFINNISIQTTFKTPLFLTKYEFILFLLYNILIIKVKAALDIPLLSVSKILII